MQIISDLIGIPYLAEGRDASGIDCWGLALEAMHRFGHDVPDLFAAGSSDADARAIYEDQRSRPEWLKVELPDPGDMCLVCMNPRDPEFVHHVGVYVGGGRVLHTMEKTDSCLIRIDDPYWSRKIRAWYRWQG